MALIQTTGNKNAAINYRLRKMSNGDQLFATEVSAGTPGAIEMTRTKASPSGRFAIGDKFFVQAGNTLLGKVGGLFVKEAFGGGPGRDLSLLLNSSDAEGNKVAEFLQLSLLDDKGRVDRASAELLARLKNANSDEDMALSVYTFHHKAGDKMGDNSDKVWDKPGSSMTLSVYQQSLISETNPKGSVRVESDQYYRQPVSIIKGNQLVKLEAGEKAPDGAVPIYDGESAVTFAKEAAAKFTSASENVSEEQTAAAPAA